MTPTDALFKSLADPTRRAIFARLCQTGEQTVAAITLQAGISQPAVSKHLAILRDSGLVAARPEGRNCHYQACPAALSPLTDWTHEMTAFWEKRFADLETLLRRMDQ